MAAYHITQNENIERCEDCSKCTINKRFHFDSLSDALNALDHGFNMSILLEKMKIKRYTGEINYNSGFTIHYKGNRIFREMELIKQLGEGKRVDAFVVDEGDNNIQIQELLDNGILNVYSFHTHKKITLFAPHPERITSLYNSIGEFPPEWLIEKSESNVRKGYNEIIVWMYIDKADMKICWLFV